MRQLKNKCSNTHLVAGSDKQLADIGSLIYLSASMTLSFSDVCNTLIAANQIEHLKQ
jgi:hypothetical protein